MCIDPPLPLATPPLRPEEERGREGAAGGDCSSPRFGISCRLTRQLGQDLFNGHTAGEGVSVSPVGGDQVVARRDGGLDACCTSFLQHPGTASRESQVNVHLLKPWNWRTASPVRRTGGRSLG